MNPSDRLSEIRARAEAATEGPWRVEQNGWVVTSEHANICGLHDGHDSRYYDEHGYPTGQGQPNAEFIANARSDVPWMVDEIVRLRAERDEAVGLVGELTDPDECWYDHHGYCQAHTLGEKPCPHERGRAFLARVVPVDEENNR